MIHNICITGDIGINKVGARDRIRVIDNTRDGIREIDNARDRIGMHNIIRSNGTIINTGGWIIIVNLLLLE